jgi:hypothetical protein
MWADRDSCGLYNQQIQPNCDPGGSWQTDHCYISAWNKGTHETYGEAKHGLHDNTPPRRDHGMMVGLTVYDNGAYNLVTGTRDGQTPSTGTYYCTGNGG